MVSTPMRCVPAAQRIVRESMGTAAPLTEPPLKIRPKAPSPSPSSSPHVSKSPFWYVTALLVTASHVSGG